MNRLARINLGLAAAATTLTLGIGSAQARDLVYYQDWQEADAFSQSWLSTGGCTTFARDPGNPPKPVEAITPIEPDCSGRYVTESVRWSGGRSSARATFPAQTGDRFCVTSWIRANAIAGVRAQPYIGLNYSASAGGFPDAQGSIGGCRNGEHWLIGDPGFNDGSFRDLSNNCDVMSDNCCGGRSTGGYGLVNPVPVDAVGWNFYAKDFTVRASDLLNGTNRVILKLQNFSNGGSNSCSTAPAPAADFDDIRVYKLGADEICPTAAEVVTQGDDEHSTCAGTKPFCTSALVPVAVVGEANARQVPQTSCVACTAGFGTNSPTACTAANPGCDPDGSCKTCNGDSGAAGTRACGAGQPYCAADGATCGQCVNDGSCNDAPGITRGGAKCVNGACTNACTITGDGTSEATCGATRYCLEGVGGGCFNKLQNDAPLPVRPQELLADQGICWLQDDMGHRNTATLFCASGVCSKADDKCGLAGGEICTADAGAAQCRAGACGDDQKCGLTSGQACTGNAECRASDCIDGNCGGAQLECTPANVATTCGPVGFVCDATNRCALGCQNGGGCPAGKACTSADLTIGQCIDAASSSSGGASSGGGGSSSGGSSGNGSTSSSSGTANSSSGGASSSSGDGAAAGEDEGGCSTSGGGAGSLTPMLVGLGVALGAFLRRRSKNADR